MTPRYPGADLAEYRDQTARQASMPGVMRPSFRCCECGRSSGTRGRKKTATGWRCASCHEAREAKRMAKEVA